MTASQLGNLQAKVSQILLEKEKYLLVKGKWRVYDLLQQAISKRGIPLQIIMSQLPHINSEISKILQGVVSFTVELEADIGSNDLDVFINYGDSRRIIEVASGMEKMIASLAIRVALINVSSLPKSDILIIDEGFGTLDDLNVEACNRMLVSLKKWFKSILIITHIDAVKDIVDNVIDITWNEKDAQVIYT
jgi:DNA repair exonuclease SbcCD ATPase subunit